MNNINNVFHFPENIILLRNTLAEAWLEVRWNLQGTNIPNFLIDPAFPFALGIFYSNIKNEFGYKEELDTVKAPEGLLPYIVQYRFRKTQKSWPLIQLGPGVATVNYTENYTWENFQTSCLYLRDNLLKAYSEVPLIPNFMALRYRNIMPFDFSQNNSLDYFKDYLNISINLPKYIPGEIASTPFPQSIDFNIGFELTEPKANGRIHLSTVLGKKEETDEKMQEVLLCDLEITSLGNEAQDLFTIDTFSKWLSDAHRVVHEWYFSLIDGKLFEMFN